MSEFSTYIHEITTVLQHSEPIVMLPTLIAIIVGLFSYFGFFFNFYRPKLPEKTFSNFSGLLLILGYFLAFFWFTQMLIFPIISNHEFIVSIIFIVFIIMYLFGLKISIISSIIGSILLIAMKYYGYFLLLSGNESAIIILLTFVYITLIIISILVKCETAENSLEYKQLYELELFSKYLSLESLQEIIEKNKKNDKSLNAYFENQGKLYRDIVREIRKNIKLKELGSLLLDSAILGPGKIILLYVLVYLNFSNKNLSIILGLLVFSYIFIALTLISMEKGITADIFRYARILVKRDLSGKIPKNMDGRVKRIDKEAVQLLVKHPDGSIHLEYIPIESIIHVELVKKPKSYGK